MIVVNAAVCQPLPCKGHTKKFLYKNLKTVLYENLINN